MARDDEPLGQQGDDERQTQGQAARETARAARGGARAARQAVRAGSQGLRQGIEDSSEAASAGLDAVRGHLSDLAEETARDADAMGGGIADRAGELADDFARLAVFPTVAGRGFQQAQEIATRMTTRVVETQIELARELARRSSPLALMEVQQRMLRHCVRATLDGAVDLLRMSQRMAEETLRPIEQSLAERGGGAQPHATVADVMTREVEIVAPGEPVREAARMMEEVDTGVLPVGDRDRLVGVITDRDIALRVVAQGKDPGETRVRDVMTEQIKYCYEDEPIDNVARNMSEQKIRRLPVMNRDKRLVGIVSIGDIASKHPERAARALRGVSQAA